MSNVSTDWKVQKDLHVEPNENIEKEVDLRHGGHNGQRHLPKSQCSEPDPS